MEPTNATQRPKWPFILAASLAGACLLACLGIGILVSAGPGLYELMIERTSLAIGDAAPDFELESLTGETVRLSGLRGQPVVLSFSASWCPDCRIGAPVMQQLHEAHPELAILMVDSGEAASFAQSFVDDFGLTYPVLLDPDKKVSDLYAIFAIPTELFLDADGVIRAKIVEAVSWERLKQVLPLIGVEP